LDFQQKIAKTLKFIKTFSLSPYHFQSNHKLHFFIPDFSVRQKKIILRNPKMDIFINVQNRNLMGSLKQGFLPPLKVAQMQVSKMVFAA
jgi:hypothetical protein